MTLEGRLDLEAGSLGPGGMSGREFSRAVGPAREVVAREVAREAAPGEAVGSAAPDGAPCFLRIPGLTRARGLRATRYSSTSLRVFPEQSEMSCSAFSSLR